jgi:hypothetical protein
LLVLQLAEQFLSTGKSPAIGEITIMIGFLSIHREALRVGFYCYRCITFVWLNSKAAASGLPMRSCYKPMRSCCPMSLVWLELM